MGTFFQAFAQADFFGKLIFLGLFALSSVSWIFLIYKIQTMRQVQKNAERLKRIISQFKSSLLTGDIPLKVQTNTHPYPSLLSVLREKTKEVLDKNHFFLEQAHAPSANYLSQSDVEMIDSHLEMTIIKEQEALEKNLFILPTTVTLAPFLGLLGTVWGILITFGELQSGGFSASNTAILGGLSTALTTTVLGLLIAIPALIAHGYLKTLGRRFVTDMHEFSHFLLSSVELQYRKVDIPHA